MSVRINADADKASRNSNLPPTNNITVFMFAKLISDTNNFATFYAQDNGTDFQVMETDSDGVTLTVFDGTGSSVGGAAMTVGDWYAIGFSSDATTLRLYMKNVTTMAAAQFFTGGARIGAATVTDLYIGGSSFNEVPNADFRAPRIFRAAFTTQAEFDAEAVSFVPVSGLTKDSWFTYADNTAAAMQNDQSGNSRDLTRGAGTWETDADPPIGVISAQAAVLTLQAGAPFVTVPRITGVTGPTDVYLFPGSSSDVTLRTSPPQGLAQTIIDDGNTLTLSAGTPTVTNVAKIIDNGNTLTLTAGQPTVTNVAKIIDNGNTLALTAGTPTVTNIAKIVDNGNTLALTAGTPTVKNLNTIVDNGNILSLTAGQPTVTQGALTIVALKATLTLSAGTPTVTPGAVAIIDNGNTLALSAGTPTVTNVAKIIDNGNTLALSAGTPTVTSLAKIIDNGNTLSLTAGTPKVIRSIRAQSLILALTAGSPAVKATNAIIDNGNTLALSAGTPTVTNVAKIIDNGNTLALSAGSPTVTNVAKIIDNGNTLSLTAGQPTVISNGVAQNIAAQAAVLSLNAGTPKVTRTIKALASPLTLTAGAITVTLVFNIRPNNTVLSLTAGQPTVKVPANNAASIPSPSLRATTVVAAPLAVPTAPQVSFATVNVLPSAPNIARTQNLNLRPTPAEPTIQNAMRTFTLTPKVE